MEASALGALSERSLSALTPSRPIAKSHGCGASTEKTKATAGCASSAVDASAIVPR